jgi:hypothetical protein
MREILNVFWDPKVAKRSLNGFRSGKRSAGRLGFKR